MHAHNFLSIQFPSSHCIPLPVLLTMLIDCVTVSNDNVNTSTVYRTSRAFARECLISIRALAYFISSIKRNLDESTTYNTSAKSTITRAQLSLPTVSVDALLANLTVWSCEHVATVFCSPLSNCTITISVILSPFLFYFCFNLPLLSNCASRLPWFTTVRQRQCDYCRVVASRGVHPAHLPTEP